MCDSVLEDETEMEMFQEISRKDLTVKANIKEHTCLLSLFSSLEHSYVLMTRFESLAVPF